MPPKPALYTARKISKTDNLYGPDHVSSGNDIVAMTLSSFPSDAGAFNEKVF